MIFLLVNNSSLHFTEYNHSPLFYLHVKFSGDLAKVVGYGHLGDGNLHFNVSAPQYDDKVRSLLENWRMLP